MAVQQDRAAAALSEAASKFRPIQLEIVGQKIQQRCGWITVKVVRGAVYGESELAHTEFLPCAGMHGQTPAGLNLYTRFPGVFNEYCSLRAE